jgi:hypothetical protein
MPRILAASDGLNLYFSIDNKFTQKQQESITDLLCQLGGILLYYPSFSKLQSESLSLALGPSPILAIVAATLRPDQLVQEPWTATDLMK